MSEKSKIFDKDTKIADLDVEQFTSLMVSVQETKAYLAAKKEQEVTQRIFSDAAGIIEAGVTPFRVRSEKDLQELVDTVTNYYKNGGKGVFVVAAALVRSQ